MEETHQRCSPKLERVWILIKSWEFACDNVDKIITKGKNICAKNWMLIDELVESIGMSFFDELDDSRLANLKIIEVEEQRDQLVATIQNISKVYISSFRKFITTPAQF